MYSDELKSDGDKYLDFMEFLFKWTVNCIVKWHINYDRIRTAMKLKKQNRKKIEPDSWINFDSKPIYGAYEQQQHID